MSPIDGDETASSASHTDLSMTAVDERAGPYRIVAPLGAGGMGTVWRAHDPVLQRDVAVKRLPPSRAFSDDARARMLREARAQAALNHPNVCTVYQAGEDDDGVWIAMELLAGPSLAERRRAGPTPPAQVVAWMAQIARALTAAHARGLVHRDLKPGNVMLHGDGDVKVLDFGLVKQIDVTLTDSSAASPDLGDTLTRAGAIMGSPRYMSPEQASGREVGPPSDVFSLGVMTYELLAGAPPFAGTTLMDTLAAIIQAAPRPLAEVAPGTPAWLCTLVHACLARDPAARPTAAAVVEALTAPRDPAPARRRAWIAGAMVAVIAGGAIAIVGVTRGGGESPLTEATAAATTPPLDARVETTAAPAPARETKLFDGVGAARVAYDTSGNNLFFVTYDERRLWRSVDGAPPRPVPGVEHALGIACCRHGAMVITLAAPDAVIAIDPVTLARSPVTGLDELAGARLLALSADGRHAAGVRYDDKAWLAYVEVVDLEPTPAHWTIPIPSPKTNLGALGWSPDNQRLAWLRHSAGDEHPAVELLDLARDRAHPIVIDHVVPIEIMRISQGLTWAGPDRLIALDSIGDDARWTELRIDAEDRVVTRAHHPIGGRRMLEPLLVHGATVIATEVSSPSQVAVADFSGDRLGVATPLDLDDARPPVGWLADGRLVFSMYDRVADVVEPATVLPGGTPYPIYTEDPGVHAIALALAGDRVLYKRKARDEKEWSLWSVRAIDGLDRHQIAPQAMFTISCAAGACVALSYAVDHLELRMLDVATGALGPVLRRPLNYDFDAGISADGRTIAVGDQANVALLDRRSGRWSSRHVAQAGAIQSVAFDGDDLILTDVGFANRGAAVLRLKPSGRVDVLISDGAWYSSPVIDRARHRLALYRRPIVEPLLSVPMPTFTP